MDNFSDHNQKCLLDSGILDFPMEIQTSCHAEHKANDPGRVEKAKRKKMIACVECQAHLIGGRFLSTMSSTKITSAAIQLKSAEEYCL